MLVIPVYPLVLVGIIVVALFSFAIWLMCYETVINRKLISTASAPTVSSPSGVSSRRQRLIRGRTRQQTARTVLASNASLRASVGNPNNYRTVRGDVTSTNAGIRSTTGNSYNSRIVHGDVTSANAVRNVIGTHHNNRTLHGDVTSTNAVRNVIGTHHNNRTLHGDVTSTNAVRNVIGTHYNTITLHGDVTSTNANLHITTNRNSRVAPVTSTQRNQIIGQDRLSDISTGQNNLAFERDEQHRGGVIGLPSYNEAVNSRRDPDIDAPPRYEDLMDLPCVSK